jgi:hypothetical protein
VPGTGTNYATRASAATRRGPENRDLLDQLALLGGRLERRHAALFVEGILLVGLRKFGHDRRAADMPTSVPKVG